MDINIFLSQLDSMFANKQFAQVDDFLKTAYAKASEEGDVNAIITILNEMTGYYREATRYDESVACAVKARQIMDEMKLQGTQQYAAMLLNEANAYRVAGRYEDAMDCYNQVKSIYENDIHIDDYMYAALYNNISILYQAMEDYESAADSLKQALDIIIRLEGADIEIAVTHTNLGATYAKSGKLAQAIEEISKAREIFEKYEPRDYHYGACVNVLGEIYYQMGQFENAVEAYDIALKEVAQNIGYDNETYNSILHSRNMAAERGNIPVKENRQYEEPFAKVEGKDDVLDKRQCEEPLVDGEGKADVLDKRQCEESFADGESKAKVMDICRAYYETYGKPMLEEKFPDYVNKIAVGLCGEGSECFGYDDEYSRDHDCGPGFCMWMPKKIYEEIGEQLNQEYNKLPQEFMGLKNCTTWEGNWRRGAMQTGRFYSHILGVEYAPVSENDWMDIQEWKLATATNGQIFIDPEGTFTKLREELLSYYPDRVWKLKLADKLAQCGQAGQYNYGRMMARGEFVTAKIALARYVEGIIELVHLINRKYCPYYKWMHKSMQNLEHLPELYDVLRALADMPDQREAWNNYEYDGKVNGNDQIALTMEIIGTVISNKLNELGISNIDNPYLEAHAQEIIRNLNSGADNDCIANISEGKKASENKMYNAETSENKIIGTETTNELMENREMDNTANSSKTLAQQSKEELIEDIVKLEWISFDKVQNEGGRADCQDDWTTFSIMRKSQYMAWTRELLESFILDIAEANEESRNLIEEKYGRMMESTAPDKYQEIKAVFPVLSDERIAIQEQIIQIQVQWMEEFAANYKYMAGNARSIHTSEDTMYNTSYETYLRGEISTYSDVTLKLYAQFIVDIFNRGDNLARIIMENTAKLYGFDSLEQADRYCRE